MNKDPQNTIRDGSDIKKIRPEFRFILDLVKPGSRVLDLGCGTGELLKTLQSERRARVQGIELLDTAIQDCVAKGLFVYQGDIDEGLADYNDKSMDYVILTNTLQVLHKPGFLIKEAARVGKQCIVSVPSFGYWQVRCQLLFTGQMPKTKYLPYEWYDTPNIHLTTIKDFRVFCRDQGLEVINEVDLLIGPKGYRRVRLFPNFFANYGIFLISEKE